LKLVNINKAAASKRFSLAQSEGNEARLRRRLQNLVRAGKRWSPFDKRIVVDQLLTLGGVVDTQNGIKECLIDHWKSDACDSNSDPAASATLVGEASFSLDIMNATPPSVSGFRHFFSRVIDSGSGLSGPSYSAHGCDGICRLLNAVYYDIAAGDCLPLDEKAVGLFDVPKKLKSVGGIEQARRPCDVRAFGRRACSLEAISAVVSRGVMQRSTKTLADSQAGFRPGLNIVQNVIKIDHVARLVALEDALLRISNVPAILLFDSRNAFGTVNRNFIAAVMAKRGYACAARRWFVEATSEVHAFADIGSDGIQYVFDIEGGFVPGDTSAALMFLEAVDVMLKRIERFCGVLDI
jgi:hypothetical protein